MHSTFPWNETYVMAKLRVTWVHSAIGYPVRQKKTIHALGLHRLHHSVEHPDNPSVRGMIFKVKHLVSVEELAEGEDHETARS